MPYILDSKADISDTSWVDDLEVTPADVVRAFGGPPRRGDPRKVSGLYSFVDGGRVFTLYDWKSTSLWDDDLPSPLAFWNSRVSEVLMIGGNDDDIGGFVSWLVGRVRAAGRSNSTLQRTRAGGPRP